ncbi:MAG: hypothetical protein ABI702_07365 [Burkholderiales bacterium]
MFRLIALALGMATHGRTSGWRLIATAALMWGASSVQAQATSTWNSIGPPGGTVSALLTSPASPSTLFAGTPENGMFTSSDAGQTWNLANGGLTQSTATGRQSLYTVYALVTDGQYVYAATATGVFYTSTQTSPSWSPLAATGAAAPITLLAYDPSTQRLFAATSGSDGVTAPQVYVTALNAGAGAPAANWTAFDLPVPPGSATVSTIAIIPPQGAGSPAGLLVGIGNSVFASSILPATLALSWSNADPAGVLSFASVTTVMHGADFPQTYACSGSTAYYSGNALDPAPLWLPMSFVPAPPANLNCNTLFSATLAIGGAPQLLLGAEQGAFVSTDGISLQATSTTPTASSVATFAVAVALGDPAPTAFMGGGFGIAGVALPNLIGGATWTPRNGPASIARGGSNTRLNNTNVIDTEVIGTRLFAAASSNQYAEVFASTDGGATWSGTNIRSVLGPFDSITALAADTANSILFAGTTQGLLAYSVATGQWAAVGASSISSVSALKLGTGALFVGTDAGVYAVQRGTSPASAVPTAAGLASSGVKALLVAEGNVYVAVLDDNGAYPVSFAAEAAVASGTPVWTAFGATPIGNDRVTALLLTGNVLLASTNGGLIQYATSGSAWSSANSSSDPAQQVSDGFGVVNALYSDGTSIYAATGNNGVFVTSTGAPFTWRSVNGSDDTALASLEVHSLRANGTVLYASTRAGISTMDGLVATVPPPQPPASSASSSSGGGGAMELGWLLGWLASVIGVAVVTPRRRREL